MSYLNQKTTLKKLLLSTAIISSVACLSSQVFAMDPPMEEGKNRTPITGKLIKDNESVVSLMYKGEYGIGHNSVLFEWKEAEDNKPKACLVAYGGVQNALTPVTRVITDILTDDMMQVVDGASSMAKAAISNLIWGDISVPGVVTGSFSSP